MAVAMDASIRNIKKSPKVIKICEICEICVSYAEGDKSVGSVRSV